MFWKIFIICSFKSIGIWNSNPNSAANKNYIFQIARSSSAGTGTTQGSTATGMGAIGYLTNGITSTFWFLKDIIILFREQFYRKR